MKVEAPAGTTAPSTHTNNFGFLRLLLASLVIVAHSPQILDGTPARELLTHIFGTLTFGELAVDFFFLISGFLIVGSLLASRSTGSYLWKRVLRIYPAFVCAFLICIFVVAPLSGGRLGEISPGGYAKLLMKMLALDLPMVPGAFGALPKGVLDSSMWTISYEFRCYLIVPVLGFLGLLKRREAILAITVGLLLAHIALTLTGLQLTWGPLEGIASIHGILRDPGPSIRLTAMFMSGACFRLYRDRITFDGRLAIACTAAALALMFVPALAEAGLATFGAYALFWIAFTQKLPALQRINNRWDISYGVYLYGWPIGALLALYVGGIQPGMLMLLTLPLALAAGALSWILVEKPLMALKKRPPDAAILGEQPERVG